MSSKKIRKITMTGMLSAIAAILMVLEFSVPLIPSFIKMDFSELPALIATFSLGPLSGVSVCFIKNLIHLLFTTSGGVGELSNFILGVCFVLPAGLIYEKMKSKKGALIGSLVGAATMAIVSLFSNYYIVYPIYTAFMPMETIISAYQVFNPSVNTLWDALLMFNLPFTFIKGLLSVIITIVIYKKLSPILKGEKNKLKCPA
ncbi:MAG: ECF transporter S component [Eubacteriales bacterium]